MRLDRCVGCCALLLMTVVTQAAESPRVSGRAFGTIGKGWRILPACGPTIDSSCKVEESSDPIFPYGAGAGVEVFVYRGLAASFDVGYNGWPGEERICIGSRRLAKCLDGDKRRPFGLSAVNGVWHFSKGLTRPQEEARLVPFLTAGYGVSVDVQRGRAFRRANVGGGLTWWLSNSVGLRAEARHYLQSTDGPDRVTLLHLGICFR